MRPSLVKSKAEAAALIHDALVRLGVARRERLSDEDFDVYQAGLRQFPAELVADVCRGLAGRAPEEFAPRFPTLGAIRQGCFDEQKRRQIQAEQGRPRLTMGTPVDPIKVDEFKARVRQLLQQRSMSW